MCTHASDDHECIFKAMPTNVTPEYKKAEEAFRHAREPRERLDCLKAMLRTIPKHKGTEHPKGNRKTGCRSMSG